MGIYHKSALFNSQECWPSYIIRHGTNGKRTKRVHRRNTKPECYSERFSHRYITDFSNTKNDLASKHFLDKTVRCGGLLSCGLLVDWTSQYLLGKSAFEILENAVFQMPDTNVVCAGAFVGAVLSIRELFSDKPTFN